MIILQLTLASDFLHITLKDVIEICVSVSVAVLAYVAINQPKKQELKKLADLRAHVISWIHYNKLQCLNIGVEGDEMVSRIRNYNPNIPLMPIKEYKLYFELILDLDKVDLTKVFVIESKDGNKNSSKLFALAEISNDAQIEMQKENEFFEVTCKEFRDCVSELTTKGEDFFHFLKKHLDTEKLQDHVYKIISEGISYGDVKYLHRFKYDLTSLVMINSQKELIKSSHHSRIIEEKIIELAGITSRVLNFYESYAFGFYSKTLELHDIEMYYRGFLTYKQYIEKRKFPKIEKNTLRMLLSVEDLDNN